MAIHFRFERPSHGLDPDAPGNTNEIMSTLLSVGAIGSQLSNTTRTACDHVDGRPESVAEHTSMLVRAATNLAARFYPDTLDVGLVALFCSVHDDVEAYVDDTATDKITDEGRRAKQDREEAGRDRLRREFSDMPFYVDLIERYEEQVEPEARFVRVVDKMMPIVQNAVTDWRVLEERWNGDMEALDAASIMGADMLAAEYPEYSELIEIRRQLDLYAISVILSRGTR